MMYQLSINLYKTINGCDNATVPTTELIRLFEQMVITRRQTMFELFRTNRSKIGMNANENKLYHISKLIFIDKLS